MNQTAKTRLTRAVPGVALCLLAALLLVPGVVQAQVKYVGDGAIQNSRGGWDLPKQGSCTTDAAQLSRPDCLALRILAADSATCTNAANKGAWTTGGVCNDLINNTQALCQAAPDRKWNAGTGVCAVVMKGDDRNNVVCAKHGGTWTTAGTCQGSWVMPNPEDAAYGTNPYGSGLLTGTRGSAAGTGDQCLRCHNDVTQYNGPRVRDTQATITMGHKNMSRPVKAGKAWGGPEFSCTGHPVYTTEEACVAGGGTWDPEIYHSDDSGNVFDWNLAKIAVGTNSYDLKWIYGDWLAPLPRAIYVGASLSNMSYSCGRCHTTGWTSDAGTTANAKKEPEQTFPGITWNGTGTTGQVKLGGGVAGDTNVMSSWDQWGISCSRCHNSAVDVTSGTLPFSSPAGMSSHHSNLTSADNNSGVCSDTRFTGGVGTGTYEDNCTTNGGTFLTACSANPTAGVCTMAANTNAKCTAVSGTWVAIAGWCSNAFYTDSTACTTNGFTWQDGWCKTADAVGTCSGGSGDSAKTWRLNGTQSSCQLASATWSYSKCSVEGLCNKGTNVTTKAACDTLGGQFAYATDIIRCVDAGGKWTGNNTNRGQVITALCMQCHRQETTGLPNTNGSCTGDATKTTPGACVAAGKSWVESGNGLPMLVGPYHSTVTWPSHPHSNQFLNSPHARFTGKWAEIATAKNFSGYNSYFMFDAEAANTGSGCTTCHEVHTSMEAGGKPFREECTGCHSGAYNKDLTKMKHPSGVGTPLATFDSEACISCHMPNGLHLWRINADAAYSTIPMPGAIDVNVAPNTAPEGTNLNAVWVDLDAACGQCHGGGSNTVTTTTTGTNAAGTTNVAVASSTGFAVGQRVRILGAGALKADGTRADLESVVKAIPDATHITLPTVGNGMGLNGGVNAGTQVIQNATKFNAPYFTKTQEATYANNIHSNPAPTAAFTVTNDPVNPLKVNVDANTSSCSATPCTFAWNWGEAPTTDTGLTNTHTFTTAGTKVIALTVTDKNGVSNSVSQRASVWAADAKPVAAGNCTALDTAWTVVCTNTSSDTNGVSQVVINWGDGSALTRDSATPLANKTYSHTFSVPGTFNITLRAVDTAGQVTTAGIGSVAKAAFTYGGISGVVKTSLGAGIPAAQVQIKNANLVVVQNLMTKADGTFAVTLKPGTYTLVPTKSGYTFGAVAPVTVQGVVAPASVTITAN